MLKKKWFVFLLTLAMGVGVPALFGYAYTVEGIYEWGGGLLTAGFVGLPLLGMPGNQK